jgi:Ca2+-binding EF-hand superfamily protein
MVSAVSSLTRGSTADKLRWIFRLYDVDCDGFISRQELRDVIVAVHRLAGNRNPSMAPAGNGTRHLIKRPTLSWPATS